MDAKEKELYLSLLSISLKKSSLSELNEKISIESVDFMIKQGLITEEISHHIDSGKDDGYTIQVKNPIKFTVLTETGKTVLNYLHSKTIVALFNVKGE